MRVILWLFCGLGLYTASASADVGLIVETPTGLLGFLSDVGHSSVWISHGCLNTTGEVVYCEHTAGIVLSSTAYWPNPGAAAIPAELFFLGAESGAAGSSRTAWDTTLQEAYPTVKPAYGRKYLGRIWRRGMRVTTFATTPEEDRRVLQQVERQRRLYHYSYSRRNCAFYAQQVLQLYLGQSFHANRLFDAGVYTPRALERALLHRLRIDEGTGVRTFIFPGTLAQSWRQPPRGFCESALFDPKYAIPLLMYQPYIYAGFGACYAITRLHAATWRKGSLISPPPLALMDSAVTATEDRRLRTYEELTGVQPLGLGWQRLGFASVATGSEVTDVTRPPGTGDSMQQPMSATGEGNDDAAEDNADVWTQ